MIDASGFSIYLRCDRCDRYDHVFADTERDAWRRARKRSIIDKRSGAVRCRRVEDCDRCLNADSFTRYNLTKVELP